MTGPNDADARDSEQPSGDAISQPSDWEQADPETRRQLAEQMEKIARAMGVELPSDFMSLTEKKKDQPG